LLQIAASFERRTPVSVIIIYLGEDKTKYLCFPAASLVYQQVLFGLRTLSLK
jgi:hypothetical protein